MSRNGRTYIGIVDEIARHDTTVLAVLQLGLKNHKSTVDILQDIIRQLAIEKATAYDLLKEWQDIGGEIQKGRLRNERA